MRAPIVSDRPADPQPAAQLAPAAAPDTLQPASISDEEFQALRATDSGDVSPLGIFTAGPGDVTRIADADPAVTVGVMSYELHPARSAPCSTHSAERVSGSRPWA